MRRMIAIASVLAALGLAACGEDEETTTSPAESQGGTTSTTTVTGETATETTTAPEGSDAGGAPASAGDTVTGAPDEGISEKPGGSESSGGGY